MRLSELTVSSGERVRDQRIARVEPLVPPAVLLDELSLGEELAQVVVGGRSEIHAILDGVDDTRTTLADAGQAAALLPQSHLVAVPHTGHSVLGLDVSRCSENAVAEFFGSRPVTQCGNVRNFFPPTPVAPRYLGALRPTAGISGVRGRAATAGTGCHPRRSRG